MILWLDAQLSPAIAVWLRMRFDLDAFAVRDLGLRDADDPDIFAAAQAAGVVVMTKDSLPHRLSGCALATLRMRD